ncbi:unnamed protein product, partial [Mesorhabditis spiculigera]
TQHDITLRCRDGVVTASRQALYYSSVYFRRRLMEPDVGDELHESSPCIIVKQALAFMLTTTFAHPGDMTVDHAEELINISLIYQPIRRNALVTAIERHLFGQLDKAKDNLPLLLQYFLLGYKWRLERLPTACSTLIFMHHQGRLRIGKLCTRYRHHAHQLRDCVLGIVEQHHFLRHGQQADEPQEAPAQPQGEPQCRRPHEQGFARVGRAQVAEARGHQLGQRVHLLAAAAW